MKKFPCHVSIIISVLACAALLSPPARAQGTWETLTSLPEPREGACVAFSSAEVGGGSAARIYVTNGYSFGDSNTVRAYDIPSDTWISSLTPASTIRSEGVGAEHGGFVYCLGGRSGVVLDVLERYDPTSDSWTVLTPMPTARAGLAAAVVGDRIFAIGGRDGTTPGSGNALNCVEAYDIDTDTWSPACGTAGALAAMPTPRMDVAAVAHGGKIYVAGGATGFNPGVNGPVVPTLQVYNPVKNTWQTRAPMPVPVANAAVSTCGQRILVIGGRNVQMFGFGGTKLDAVQEFNPNTNSWLVLDPIPTGRSEEGAEFHGGRIYVLGSGLFGASLADNEALDCSSIRP